MKAKEARKQKAIKLGWRLNTQDGFGLLHPDGREMGYQHFSDPSNPWKEGLLTCFVRFRGERFISAWNHFRSMISNLWLGVIGR